MNFALMSNCRPRKRSAANVFSAVAAGLPTVISNSGWATQKPAALFDLSGMTAVLAARDQD